MGANTINGPHHKSPNNLNEPREVHHAHPSPRRAAPAAAQPAVGGDGVDRAPAPGTQLPDSGNAQANEATAKAHENSLEMHQYTMAMMQIQHEQAIQKIVIETASSISKNAADIAEFCANKI
jgi:hypothetical protein